MVDFSASCGSPSFQSSLGAIKMLIVQQLMSARIRCISPCRSRILTLWIMCEETGVSVPQRYLLNI